MPGAAAKHQPKSAARGGGGAPAQPLLASAWAARGGGSRSDGATFAVVSVAARSQADRDVAVHALAGHAAAALCGASAGQAATRVASVAIITNQARPAFARAPATLTFRRDGRLTFGPAAA